MNTVDVPYFDGATLRLDAPEVYAAAAGDDRGAAALRAFLALGPADRLADSRHVHAYYGDSLALLDEEDAANEEMPVPATPEAIWAHVHPQAIHLGYDPDDGDHWYVIASCECDWEVEHGLGMAWRDGRTLCKVGQEDGHATNSRAYGDDSLGDVVYRGVNPEFRTLADR